MKLTKIFGNNPTVKIIDFLMENKKEFALTEISRKAKVSYPSVKLIIPKLLKNRIILIDRKIGKIKFYKINENNFYVKKINM